MFSYTLVKLVESQAWFSLIQEKVLQFIKNIAQNFFPRWSFLTEILSWATFNVRALLMFLGLILILKNEWLLKLIWGF